jgi:hypothetical protein
MRENPILEAWKKGWKEVERVMDSLPEPTKEQVLREQRCYFEQGGNRCYCSHCGKARQSLSGCICGAP